MNRYVVRPGGTSVLTVCMQLLGREHASYGTWHTLVYIEATPEDATALKDLLKETGLSEVQVELDNNGVDS